MTYVQGFVTPVPNDKKDAFADHSRRASAIFRDLGSGRVVDAWGDDVPAGKVNDFAGAVALKEGETVGFGWMEFADKAAGDAFYQKMMSDPRMAEMGDMPFDGKRMIFGGFEALIDDGTPVKDAYVDGFIVPVPAGNRQAYLDMATKASAIFREHGVSRYVECWAADVPKGEVTDFYRAAHAEEGEEIVFSWCEWPDKATRDAGSAKIMADERLGSAMESAPFDGKRMIYGGFCIVNDG
ncbi:DUF1428 domain-containing protein [Sphingomonas sp.]|uniref:DUF1428 domain-containing protein n=1 Tax=Sphingomonas sp. TaxID=28214 RepID=UPI0035C80FCF